MQTLANLIIGASSIIQLSGSSENQLNQFNITVVQSSRNLYRLFDTS